MTAPIPPDPQATAAEEQAGAGAGTVGTGAQARGSSAASTSDVVGDIGQGEAYTQNMKMLVAHEFGHHQRLAGYAELALKNALDISQQISQNAVTNANQIQQSHANNQVNANQDAHTERQRTIRHGDLAADRQWNIDEQTHVTGQVLRSAETSIRTADLASAIGIGIVAAMREMGMTVTKT